MAGRSTRKPARVSPAPSPTRATAAALRRRRAEEAEALAEWVGPRAIPPAPGRVSDRGDFTDLDLTEPDDIELWLGGQLRDWQLTVGAETLGQLKTVCDRMLAEVRAQREGVKNDLRAEGYLEGQANVLETITGQVQKAIDARLSRIGERVERA